MNRNCVKVSYRCLPNMGSVVAKHNSKVLRQAASTPARPPPSCNCQKSRKAECPLPGACNQTGVVYQSNITSDAGNSVKDYVGLAENFKKRFFKHRTSMKEYDPENSTTLSTHYWKQFDSGKNPIVTWKFLETNIPSFNPVTNICRLCLREKYNIVLKPHLATLNKRCEIFSACRHKSSKLLCNSPSPAPD